MNITKSTATTFSKNNSINSYDFWKILNNLRVEDGVKPIRHNDFLARVIDECEDLTGYETFVPKKQTIGVDTYQLNQKQMLLVGMRESKVVRRHVLKWLEDLTRKISDLETEKVNRASASLNYVEQNAVLKAVRDSEDKVTMPYHYSNEANLINRIILGMTAKQYREDNNFDKTVNLRDTLSIVELECVGSLENTNKELIKAGLSYEDRKVMLLKVFKRDLSQKLIDEMVRLES